MPRKTPPHRNKEIADKRKKGWLLKDIAEHYGLSIDRILQILKTVDN